MIYLIKLPQNDIAFSASIGTSLMAALGLSLLMFLQRYRSIPCFDLTTLYLISAILLDFMLWTVPLGMKSCAEMSHPVLIRCIFHAALLLLEFWKKSSAIDANATHSPEEVNGFLSKVFFTWINSILFLGYRNILSGHDLPPLSQDMKPELTRMTMLRVWDQRGKSNIFEHTFHQFLNHN